MAGSSTVGGRPVTAVTVDLDDTLYPQAAWLDGAWRAVARRAAELGLPGGRTHEALVAVAAEGSDRGRVIDRALLAAGVDAADLPAVLPHLVAAFAAHAPDRLPAYPGALEALDELRRHVPVALVTDGAPAGQRAKIAALGLGGRLDAVAISDELPGGRAVRKPHPAPFAAALAALGAAAAEAVHVGDRPGKDVTGAAGAGIRAVRVRTGEYARAKAEPGGPVPVLEVETFAEAVRALLPVLAGKAAGPVGVAPLAD